VDWLRAKLMFIVAFLALDLFLGWEVSRLAAPLLAGGAPAAAARAAP
jgi:hypothetical protein